DRQLRPSRSECGWGLPGIPIIDLHHELVRVLFVFVKGDLLDGDIGAELGFRATTVLPKVNDQRDQRPQGQERLSDDGPEHRLGPIRHTLLRYNITPLALLALIPIGVGLLFAGFGYFIGKAVDSRRYRWAAVGGVSA